MTPTQFCGQNYFLRFVRHCLTNLKGIVKLTHVAEVGAAKTSLFANKFALKFHSRRIWLVCDLVAAGRLFAKSIRCNYCYSARFVSLWEFRKKIFGRCISNRMETRTIKIGIIYLFPLYSPLLSVFAPPNDFLSLLINNRSYKPEFICLSSSLPFQALCKASNS